MSKVTDRRCQVCTAGVVEPDGYGLDGRPQYRCARCGSVGSLWALRFSMKASSCRVDVATPTVRQTMSRSHKTSSLIDTLSGAMMLVFLVGGGLWWAGERDKALNAMLDCLDGAPATRENLAACATREEASRGQ